MLTIIYFFLLFPTSPAQDIDAPHVNDPHMCAQYVNDIYAHLRESEHVRKPNANYMQKVQKDINPTMRGILVDWLVEVAEEYKLSADTLFLSVLYIDRCLSVHTVARTQLQVSYSFFFLLFSRLCFNRQKAQSAFLTHPAASRVVVPPRSWWG